MIFFYRSAVADFAQSQSVTTYMASILSQVIKAAKSQNISSTSWFFRDNSRFMPCPSISPKLFWTGTNWFDWVEFVLVGTNSFWSGSR